MTTGTAGRRGAWPWVAALVFAASCEAAEPAAGVPGAATGEAAGGQPGTTGSAPAERSVGPATGGASVFGGEAATDGQAAPGGGPGDALTAAARVAFRWADEQPPDGRVLTFKATSGADTLVRLRLTYDLGAVCAEHGPHLLPRLSLEPGATDTRTIRWRMAHPELAGATELRVQAALRYPAAGPEAEVLRRIVGQGPVAVEPQP